MTKAPAPSALQDTASEHYTSRLKNLSGAWWKRVLNVQAPYQWNLRRLKLGRTLDVGCGIGRNFKSMHPASIGVDHNQSSVDHCSNIGFEAYTPDVFFQKHPQGSVSFDSILIAHVFEHLTSEQDLQLLQQYLPYLRQGGKVVIITPQEAGYRSDMSHVEFMPFDKVAAIAEQAGVVPKKCYSFPFPRFVGAFFRYNEFVFVGTKV